MRPGSLGHLANESPLDSNLRGFSCFNDTPTSGRESGVLVTEGVYVPGGLRYVVLM